MSPTRIVTTALTLTVLTSGSVAQAQFGRGSVFRKLFDRGSSTSHQTNRRNTAISAAQPTRAEASEGADARASEPAESGYSTLDNGTPVLRIFGATLAFNEGAATIHAVEPGGDAERAGLQPGDRLDTISGLEIDQLDVLSAMGEVVSRGEEIPLGLLRQNASGEFEPHEATLIVSREPPPQVALRASQPSDAQEAADAEPPELGSILHSPAEPAASGEEPQESAVEPARETPLPTAAYKGWSREQLAARVQALEQELRTQQATISNQAAELRTLRR